MKRSLYELVVKPLDAVVYYQVLYRSVYAEARRAGRNVKYMLIPPEPWLLAIADLMWQGILQGLAWDVLKGITTKALDAMREKGVAPALQGNTRRAKKSRTSLGFHWAQYADNGRKQYQLFVGLRRVHDSMSIEDRKVVSGSYRPKRGSAPKPT